MEASINSQYCKMTPKQKNISNQTAESEERGTFGQEKPQSSSVSSPTYFRDRARVRTMSGQLLRHKNGFGDPAAKKTRRRSG
jgi:hypothetical protein